jgi:membrane associated rhomboid family serine protease
MGIHDRHYIRERSSQPGGLGGVGLGGMRAWSVNTWLIVICIAVFMVDGFLPPRTVPMDRIISTQFADKITATQATTDPGDTWAKVNQWEYRRPLYGTTVQGQHVQVGWEYGQPMQFLQSLMHFSTQRGFLKLEFWRFIGFQFMHANLTHVLFNMIGLFFFGPMVERYLGSKRYLAFYLLCGICGALMYTLLNLAGFVAVHLFGPDARIPGLLFHSTYTPLIGASAGVFGVLMAGAKLAPNARVLLFFILPMKLRTLAYGLVVLALWRIVFGGTNAGGEAGHLGGALAGFYFIRHPQHLHGFFDLLGRVDPTSHHYRAEARQRAVAKGARARGQRPTANRAQIDRILDKINQQGLQSLSEREKRILREASEND